MSTETACSYCGQPVPDDYDGETGRTFNYGYHWGCVWETTNGPWQVVTRQHAVSPMRETTRSYGTQRRAREVAAETRRNNLREWPCGADLDIIVRPRPEPETAASPYETARNPWGIHCAACNGPDRLCDACDGQVAAERGEPVR